MAASTQTTTYPALLRAYLGAVYRIGDGDGAIELIIGKRFPRSPSRGRAHALITACNPGSIALSRAGNDVRTARLQCQVEKLGIDWQAASSQSPKGDWHEPSLWLSDIELSTIDALAVTFEQNACVIVDASGRIGLRVYRNDWHAAAPNDRRLQWPTIGAAA
jgi:hypothetical protein